MRDRYDGKVALISGAASGIGQCVVEGIAREGGRVVFSDLRKEAGHATEEELRGLGLDVQFKQSDGTDDASVRELYAFVIGKLGALDVAINNVGNQGKGEIVDMTIEDMTYDIWKSSIDQNLTSCFLGMKYAVQWMKGHGGGAICSTASLAGIRIPGTTPSYIAAKAGVIHLTRYIAITYAINGIRANAVAPGMTGTQAMINAFPDPEYRREFISRYQPGGRLIDPNETAAAFLWLCSDDASAVNGHTIPVDDGWAAT